MRRYNLAGICLLLLLGCTAPAPFLPAGPAGPPAMRTLIGTSVAGSVTHAHVCTQSATTSTTDIDCPDWNDSHVFGGTAAAQGLLPYYDSGETTRLNWTTGGILFDETTTSVRLFGGTVGTNGVKVLSLGGQATAPTTSPADTVQLWAQDGDGAGTTDLAERDEGGGSWIMGSDHTGAWYWNITPAGGAHARIVSVGKPLALYTDANLRLDLDSTNGNVGFNTSTFGATAAKTLAIATGTAPTSAPAGEVQVWSQNRGGANTASLFVRSEDSGINESIGQFVQAADTTERTTTSLTSVDLSTLTVNIPVGDAFTITGLVRKTAGAAATVSIGLKLNGTQIFNNMVVSTATNQAEDGVIYLQELAFQPGISNYNHAVGRLSAVTWPAAGTGTATTAASSNFTVAAVVPSAAITSVTITGLSGSASVTLAIKNITVHRVAKQ